MKISEYIEKLKEIQGDHGDLYIYDEFCGYIGIAHLPTVKWFYKQNVPEEDILFCNLDVWISGLKEENKGDKFLVL